MNLIDKCFHRLQKGLLTFKARSSSRVGKKVILSDLSNSRQLLLCFWTIFKLSRLKIPFQLKFFVTDLAENISSDICDVIKASIDVKC